MSIELNKHEQNDDWETDKSFLSPASALATSSAILISPSLDTQQFETLNTEHTLQANKDLEDEHIVNTPLDHVPSRKHNLYSNPPLHSPVHC